MPSDQRMSDGRLAELVAGWYTALGRGYSEIDLANGACERLDAVHAERTYADHPAYIRIPREVLEHIDGYGWCDGEYHDSISEWLLREYGKEGK